jgi:hypothetical protein
MTRKLVDVDWRFAPDFMRVSSRRKDDRICCRAVPPSRDSSSVFHHEAIAAFLGFRGKTVCGRIDIETVVVSFDGDTTRTAD